MHIRGKHTFSLLAWLKNMKADKPRLGSFLSFFFLGFLPLPLPLPPSSSWASSEALALAFALLFFAGFSVLESGVGVGVDLCFAFFCCKMIKQSKPVHIFRDLKIP